MEIAFDDSDTELLTLEDCSDIYLKHLKELEFGNFAYRVGEMELVKLMLANSPVLKKVRSSCMALALDRRLGSIWSRPAFGRRRMKQRNLK
ncbi:F-box/FBD/LRR-repeat protein-like protein [Tanacetum coccineum]